MSKKVLIIIVGIVVVGGGIFLWQSRRKRDEEPVLNTAKVERGDIVSTISASGNLLQTNTFAITTPVTGIVKEVFVQDGDEVQKGQKLIELTLDQASEENRISAWSAYLSARNAQAAAKENKVALEKGVEDAQSKLIAAQQDFDEDWGSTDYWDDERCKRWSDLKSAEMALTVAEQKYSQADEAIEKADADLALTLLSHQRISPVITAPQAGEIANISVVSGMSVSSPTQKILSITGEQQPLVSVSVNEIDIPEITNGQKVELVFDAFPNQNFDGEVVGVDRSGTQTQGVVDYEVLVQLNAKKHRLYSNMTVAVEIVVESRESVLWVPAQAAVKRRGERVVMVLENELPEPKSVEIGLETATQIEIVSGLSEGEVVIIGEQSFGDQDSPFGGMGGFKNMMSPSK